VRKQCDALIYNKVMARLELVGPSGGGTEMSDNRTATLGKLLAEVVSYTTDRMGPSIYTDLWSNPLPILQLLSEQLSACVGLVHAESDGWRLALWSYGAILISASI
jgi:hypothetical protein